MSRHARLGAFATLLAAISLALVPGGANALSTSAGGPYAKAPARHGKRRGRCARPARRRSRQARRCRARPHRRASAPVAPVAPIAASVAPPVAGAPAVQALAPSLASTPAPIIISSAPASEEAAPVSEAEQPPPPSIPHVQVSAVEYSFSLSRTTVPAGEVVLEFVNDGQDEHNLHLEGGEGPLSESIANTPSKGVSDLHLQMQPGSYTLFCSLPTHEARGMKATLTVE
jgi:plastocyanin